MRCSVLSWEMVGTEFPGVLKGIVGHGERSALGSSFDVQTERSGERSTVVTVYSPAQPVSFVSVEVAHVHDRPIQELAAHTSSRLSFTAYRTEPTLWIARGVDLGVVRDDLQETIVVDLDENGDAFVVDEPVAVTIELDHDAPVVQQPQRVDHRPSLRMLTRRRYPGLRCSEACRIRQRRQTNAPSETLCSGDEQEQPAANRGRECTGIVSARVCGRSLAQANEARSDHDHPTEPCERLADHLLVPAHGRDGSVVAAGEKPGSHHQ